MILAQRKVTGHRKFLKDFGIDTNTLDWLDNSDMEHLREIIEDIMLNDTRKFALDTVTILAQIIAEQRKQREKIFQLLDALASS